MRKRQVSEWLGKRDLEENWLGEKAASSRDMHDAEWRESGKSDGVPVFVGRTLNL